MGYQHCWPFFCIVFISTIHFIHAHNAPEDYVNAHNAARKELGLEPMTWDCTVARFAEQYAGIRKHDCALEHSNIDKYGENLAVGSGEFSGLDAVKMWVGEKADYNYESNSCPPSKMCGHYTQVVWKKSIRLGCARVECLNGGIFITCNYDPPGNYIGEKPY